MSLPLGTPDSHHREGAGCCEGATTNASAQLCPTYVTPRTVARQASLSVGFSRQEYWSGQPFPIPGDLPSPGDRT